MTQGYYFNLLITPKQLTNTEDIQNMIKVVKHTKMLHSFAIRCCHGRSHSPCCCQLLGYCQFGI